MRIDKFLKISRIIKRRPIAKKIADQGRVFINGNEAKSSSKVGVGDQILIKFGNKELTVEVKQLLQTTKKADSDQMFAVIDEKYHRDYEAESEELL
ncbi:RNA-binding S4 domain-containing protein [Fructilactobacillus vespulae]|uniref:RNA-binding S4 domain-containing protein n=1 Tax=Fructilactobacillus vespulae TaxID=1249630 RepID=UPI0039B3E422